MTEAEIREWITWLDSKEWKPEHQKMVDTVRAQLMKGLKQ